MRRIEGEDGLAVLIGPAEDGTPLEIGILDLDGDAAVVIHAMRVRAKFIASLDREQR
jgi:hypothetical protein